MKRKGFYLVLLLISLILLLMLSWLLPELGKARRAAQLQQCRDQLFRLGQVCLEYANRHQDRLPATDQWCDVLLSAAGSETLMQCPSLPQARAAYGLNAAVAGHRLSTIRNPKEVVLLFETDGGWNTSGGRELLTHTERHRGNLNFCFCDGSARWVPRSEMNRLIWTPQFTADTAEIGSVLCGPGCTTTYFPTHFLF